MIDTITEWVAEAKRLVVFTGAGVSTESGIPDFRSSNGLWARYDPGEFSYQNFIASQDARRRYWQLGCEIYATMRDAKPNAAHVAIAELEQLGLLDALITQNVDHLHQRAGVSPERVIELHGNATRVRCLSCDLRYPRDEIQSRLEGGEDIPTCGPPCNGILKPSTILFGEAMPLRETQEAERRAAASDCFLVVGSSLVVYPAAVYPIHAKQSGARLIIVNLQPTPHDPYADAVAHEKAGPFMQALLQRVRQIRSHVVRP